MKAQTQDIELKGEFIVAKVSRRNSGKVVYVIKLRSKQAASKMVI